MVEVRRARPTIRCQTQDLGIPLPNLDIDLASDADQPLVDELRRPLTAITRISMFGASCAAR